MTVYFLKIWRKVERGFKRIYRPVLMRQLEQNNKQSSCSILNPNGPIVTLTTFGERISSVFYTIESIALGDLQPSRLTLWLNKDEYQHSLPKSLERLKKRGLDIKPCTDHGPHKKYLPEVQAYPNLDIPFVTADDDILYPRYWLKKLNKAYEKNPSNIYCYRAHHIAIQPNADFSPYKSWKRCLSLSPSHLHFSTGDCGVLFPPKMRKILYNSGENFVDLCPKADDIWLNYRAFLAAIPVAQIVKVPKHFYEIPGTRNGALANFNNGLSGNDKQLLNTYPKSHRQHLLSITQNTSV